MRCRLALAADLPALADALGAAFVDDPMVRWVVGTDDAAACRRSAAAGFFAPGLRAGLRRGHTYAGVGDGGAMTGAAIWSPPDVAMFDDAAVADLTGSLAAAAGDAALERLGAIGELVGVHHPEGRPHFYLFTLGSAARGRGLGALLVAPVLERCDADGLPAYLESSNPRNLGFYERLGFTAIWDGVPAPGGPLLTGMWREPKPG